MRPLAPTFKHQFRLVLLAWTLGIIVHVHLSGWTPWPSLPLYALYALGWTTWLAHIYAGGLVTFTVDLWVVDDPWPLEALKCLACWIIMGLAWEFVEIYIGLPGGEIDMLMDLSTGTLGALSAILILRRIEEHGGE